MKRLTLGLLASLLIILAGCNAEEKPTPTRDVKAEFSSNTSAEDCYLCGDGIESLIPSYWGQKNVALISLNTFEIIPIEINRYDEIDGHLIEEYTDPIPLEYGNSANGGFSGKMLLDYNHGFATSTMYISNDETLDINRASSFLCADCLNKFEASQLGSYFGVGVIDLETKEIRPFYKNVNGFALGDYFVYYDVKGRGSDDSLCMGFIIFYCPLRFGDPPLNEWTVDGTGL